MHHAIERKVTLSSLVFVEEPEMSEPAKGQHKPFPSVAGSHGTVILPASLFEGSALFSLQEKHSAPPTHRLISLIRFSSELRTHEPYRWVSCSSTIQQRECGRLPCRASILCAKKRCAYLEWTKQTTGRAQR